MIFSGLFGRKELFDREANFVFGREYSLSVLNCRVALTLAKHACLQFHKSRRVRHRNALPDTMSVVCRRAAMERRREDAGGIRFLLNGNMLLGV